MFLTGILLGTYSYIIFFLGIINLLTVSSLVFSLIIFLLTFILLVRNRTYGIFKKLQTGRKSLTKFQTFIIFTIIFQAIVNLIGVLGPEIGFDALWYHLTIPKIFLQEHSIFYIKGNLFYYSLQPKLTEMLYIVSLAFWDERGAKLIHFCFGILTLFALFKLSRIFLDRTKSLLVIAVFYSNLVVGWESASSYVDLTRAFYETASLYFLFLFFSKNKKEPLIKSAVFLGFATCVKVLSLFSILIFLSLIYFSKTKKKLNNSFFFIFISIAIPLPWFLYALIQSNNPIYPIFSGYSNYGVGYLSVPQMLKDVFVLFFRSPDPLTPLYVMFLPFVLVYSKKYSKTEQLLLLYSGLSLLIWCITPRTGESRFFIPYLPALSIVAVLPLKFIKDKIIYKTCVVIIIILLFISILYRGAANIKFLPFEIGIESRQDFLMKNLNFSYGDFYDENNKIKNIVKEKKVLLYGLHNLFYIDFPFVDSTYIKKGDRFSYVLVQNVKLPARFKNPKLVYSNSKTFVKLYYTGENTW